VTIVESIVGEAALSWFQVLGYAVIPGPKLAPGEPATAERDLLRYLVLEGRLCEAIPQLNAATCNTLRTTVAKSATVQSSSWLNP
jgi:type I restriction enzyme R subunit